MDLNDPNDPINHAKKYQQVRLSRCHKCGENQFAHPIGILPRACRKCGSTSELANAPTMYGVRDGVLNDLYRFDVICSSKGYFMSWVMGWLTFSSFLWLGKFKRREEGWGELGRGLLDAWLFKERSITRDLR